MGLQSRLFKGVQALEDCLVDDRKHIVPGAVGDHVSRIQQALFMIDTASIDSGELGQSRYGPSTAAAVLAFKRKRNIINRAYQSVPDNIVGKMTIATLDKLLPAGPAPAPAPPPVPRPPGFVNQPAGEQFLIASVKHNPAKIDLDFSARPVRASRFATERVRFTSLLPTADLEQNLMLEMAVGGVTALTLFEAWKRNITLSERNFSGLDAAVAGTPGFISAATRFEQQVKRNLDDQFFLGQVDYHDLVTGDGPVRPSFSTAVPQREFGKATRRLLTALEPPSVDLDLTEDRVAKICIGSFQAVDVFIKGFVAGGSPPTFRATLKYVARDHFGVDDDDCEIARAGLHGTPGQVSMWILQHHRRPGHVPWITLVNVERPISGRLSR